ncbi:MAG TPA: S8 family serine peptidase, partial [Solirubrobacterales bacterium]|nr:S8 family serine peptidase [Solirubrobacterales bacterium]
MTATRTRVLRRGPRFTSGHTPKRPVLCLAALLVAFAAAETSTGIASGETYTPPEPQEIPKFSHRVFAADTTAAACKHEGTADPAVNAKLDVDCVDDHRVDADIAVIDSGVDESTDLNIVRRVDCVHPDNPFGNDPENPLAVEAPYVSPPESPSPLWHPDPALNAEAGTEEYGPEAYGCLENSGEPGDPSGHDKNPLDGVGHGTRAAERAAAIDNNIGSTNSTGVGVAPGARIWNVKVLDPGLETILSAAGPLGERYEPQWSMSSLIAGVDWVSEHADQIDVATLDLGCKLPGDGAPEIYYPHPVFIACSSSSIEELNAAIDAAVEKGVVFVVAAGESAADAATIGAPQNDPNVILVNTVIDQDGLPVHSSAPTAAQGQCSGFTVNEDTLSSNSNYGDRVTMTAPFSCVATDASAPQVAGAAAILASRCDPSSAQDVREIAAALTAEGNTASKEDGGWEDSSGDGSKESLLDISNEKVFDPVMVGEEREPVSCAFTHPDPIAAYSFDENQGTVAHDSTGNHDGTIEGGASWSGEGKYGSALDFNGTN